MTKILTISVTKKSKEDDSVDNNDKVEYIKEEDDDGHTEQEQDNIDKNANWIEDKKTLYP